MQWIKKNTPICLLVGNSTSILSREKLDIVDLLNSNAIEFIKDNINYIDNYNLKLKDYEIQQNANENFRKNLKLKNL